MRLPTRALLVCLTLLTFGSVSCGSKNPTAPGGGGTGACRIYATKSDIRTTTLGFTLNASQTASFDTSKRTYTVVEKFANNGATCSTAVSSYNSVADFVDETSVNPGRMLSTGTTGTNSGACGSGSSGSSTNTYDSQRRILKVTRSDGSVTTYTAWDSEGRPTASTDTRGTTITYVYDDAARTLTTTSVTNGVTTTLLETYDANGNVTSLTVTTAGITTTTTFDNTDTASVCK